MVFCCRSRVHTKLNDAHFRIGKVNMGSTNHVPRHYGRVFVRALRVGYGLDWFLIDYPKIGDCNGDMLYRINSLHEC